MGPWTGEMSPWAGALASPGLILLLSLTVHRSHPQAEGFFQSELDEDGVSQWASANASLLHSFWCQPAGQLSRDQLSALVRRMVAQQVLHEAWQLSCLANLVGRRGLQDDFERHPPDLLLFYDLTQVRGDECQAFTRHASQGDTELLANLPDQRVALQRKALDCLVGGRARRVRWGPQISGSALTCRLHGGPRQRLSASDLLLLRSLVCDMNAASIVAADPHVLRNLQCCPRLTAAQQDALNTLLASGRTALGSPGSWTLEGLQALGHLVTHISPWLWMQVPEVGHGILDGRPPAYPRSRVQQAAVGPDFFCSAVSAYQEGRLGPRDTRHFVTGFLQARANMASLRPRRGTGGSPGLTTTGRACIRSDITAATLWDNLFLVHYDCPQLESCLGSRMLRANLDPLLQHPLPVECQRVVKAKLGQIYPRGIPEDQLWPITSLVYLYLDVEIGQWNVTSETVLALLAADVALNNQTEAVLQKFLDHNGTLTNPLLMATGGSRLCMSPRQIQTSPRQIQTIQPSEFWLAGALDISACPQSRKDVLYAKAPKAYSGTRTAAAYYCFMHPYLGGAPVEELQHLAQANVSMDVDTFTNLNPRVLQSLSVDNVKTLLGQNVGDLQKAHSHPTISSWLRSLNHSALGKLGLDTDVASTIGPAFMSRGTPNTQPQQPLPAHPSGLPGSGAEAPTSGGPQTPLGSLPLALVLPSSLLWLLYWAPLSPLGLLVGGPHCRQRCPRDLELD
ncbi:LOW QUALITY PROTEIN: mesothelin [Dugong dugon]